MILKGKKIYLKKGFSDKEYAALLGWFHDIDFVAYLSFAKEALALKTVDEVKAYGNNLEGTTYFGIYDGDTNKLMGYVFIAEDKNNGCEFGIGLDKKYWGKGFGFEATKLLIDYIFNKLKLKRIYLSTSEYNKSAIHIYNKAGFKITKIKEKDREVYHNNKWIKSNSVYMEIKK